MNPVVVARAGAVAAPIVVASPLVALGVVAGSAVLGYAIYKGVKKIWWKDWGKEGGIEFN